MKISDDNTCSLDNFWLSFYLIIVCDFFKAPSFLRVMVWIRLKIIYPFCNSVELKLI